MSFLHKLRRTPSNPSGEMPFFDHLEELRWRIIWSLLALILCTAVSFYAAVTFDILGYLKRPVEPFLPDGKLLALSVTDPFFITFKLALTMGFVAAAPVIAYQIWAFLAPALTQREKRAIVPSLYLGVVLFAGGVTLAYVYALPMTLKFLLSTFQQQSLTTAITAGYYFSFVIGLLLAFGIVFELPVVILILAALRLVTSKFLASKRRYAIAGMAITAALITPGDAITATFFMMGPLLVLYEISILLAKMVERGRARDAAAEALMEAR